MALGSKLIAGCPLKHPNFTYLLAAVLGWLCDLVLPADFPRSWNLGYHQRFRTVSPGCR